MTSLPPGFQADFRAPYEATPDSEMMEEVRGMTSGQRDGLRRRAQKDRYFLARGIIGYKDVNPYTHGPLCRALQDKSKQRRMFLMHRGSLKTTIATVTDCVGDALEDPNETRILILNEVEANAIGFLSEIKAIIEHNPLINELFPELIPDKFGGPGSRWSTNQACLKRDTTYAQWTWSAAGVGSAKTGNHYSKIKCDDLIGFEARESPAAMRFAVAYAKALEPLLIDMDSDFIDFVGTRWSLVDLYREMLMAYGSDMAYFAREDIEEVPPPPDGTDAFEYIQFLRSCGFGWQGKGNPERTDREIWDLIGTPQPIFPRKFSLKKLSRLSVIDPVLYFAQYKNNPIADGMTDFDIDQVNWFDFDDAGNIVYRDKVTNRLARWDLAQCDIVMCGDPNSGELTAKDPPARGVYALSPKRQMFCLESWSKRVEPDAYIDGLYDSWAAWNPRVCGIERAGTQTANFYFKRKAREKGVTINVVENKPKNREKSVRIRKALQPFINQGDFYVRKSQTTLRHQLQFHPNVENDDELDCAAYATELFIAPLTQKEQDEEDSAVNFVMSRRSSSTGYSQ